MPDKHRPSHVPQEPLPGSLARAIRVFLLAGAVRRARGQARQHHTMLVHVTMYTAVQRIVADQIGTELGNLHRLLTFGEGAVEHGLWAELETIYVSEFVDKEQ